MKILWLVPADQASWVIALSRQLAKVPGLSLTILSTSSKIEAEEETELIDGITYIRIRTLARVRYDMLTLYLVRALRMKKAGMAVYKNYDLIHIHGTEYQWQLAGAAMYERPVILSVQGLLKEYAPHVPRNDRRYWNWKIQSLYEHLYMPRIKHYMCRTHWDKFHVAKMNPTATIHHSWELMRHEFYEAQAPVTAFGSKRMVFMGGTNSIKGIAEALQVYDRLHHESGITLTIIGRTHLPVIERIIRKYGLKNTRIADLELLNFLNPAEIIQVFSRCFCLLHPSYIDNSPNSVSEAQLVGLPVAASDVGGVSSIIENEQTGLLTDLNPDNIYKAVKRLNYDKTLWGHISRQGITVARERHNPESITAATLAIYQDLINRYKR